MKNLITLLFCFSVVQISFGQLRDIAFSEDTLETIFLTGNKLKDFSVGQTLYEFQDSVFVRQSPMLTSLLEYNSSVYFKQNGLGMVSSPSFRGTTASHTAVLWNGININSNFLGQTDFNTINISGYDYISVRAGGGSLVYGSGAIGGTVHLDNQLDFKKVFENNIYLNYGSFQTSDARYKLKLSSEKVSFKLALAHNQSENDYKYQLREGKNTNGQFENFSVNSGLGFKINSLNKILVFNEIYQSDRNFPVYYLTEIPTQYKDFNTRNLVEWKSRFGKFNSDLKTAFWTENYKYFPDSGQKDYSFGKAKNFVGKYDLDFKVSRDMLFHTILEHLHTNGKGSDVEQETRDISAIGLIFKHGLNQSIKSQFGLRQEISSSYGSPFLWSLGMEYEVSPFYTTKLSASKNYKRPTFNDLYWTQSGNPDLEAENSQQIEIGNHLNFKDFKLNLTGYFNDIRNMIHWLPESNGLFKPRNEDHIQTYGGEVSLSFQKEFNHKALYFTTTYAYTVSENQQTKKQLIYVPYHKATFSSTFISKKIQANYQLLYNGKVFTRSDNNPNHKLKDYLIANLDVSYDFGKDKDFVVGGRIQNLFNKAYENVKRYEMPGINFNVFVNLKI